MEVGRSMVQEDGHDRAHFDPINTNLQTPKYHNFAHPFSELTASPDPGQTPRCRRFAH
jgi:hypothetical protein